MLVIIDHFKFNFHFNRLHNISSTIKTPERTNAIQTALVCNKAMIAKFNMTQIMERYFHNVFILAIPNTKKKRLINRKLDSKFLCELAP